MWWSKSRRVLELIAILRPWTYKIIPNSCIPSMRSSASSDNHLTHKVAMVNWWGLDRLWAPILHDVHGTACGGKGTRWQGKLRHMSSRRLSWNANPRPAATSTEHEVTRAVLRSILQKMSLYRETCCWWSPHDLSVSTGHNTLYPIARGALLDIVGFMLTSSGCAFLHLSYIIL